MGTPKHSDLIYDVGVHKGEDSEYYLRKGFRVVGFEADPLGDLGYDCFQAIEQSAIPFSQSPPNPPGEGSYVVHRFEEGGGAAGGGSAMKPKVSVLLPVYNGGRYLGEAVDSILRQTFTDFEFIIIDDGSTDRSAEIVTSYSDRRIRLIRNGSNLGLIATLNRGLGAASGEYIARMDADDVSLPERLSRQVAFMDARPELVASGTWAKEIDEDGNITGDRRITFGEQMEYGFWWPCPIIHPSAIIRRSLLGDLRYDPGALHAEDYDLWLSLKKKYALDNLPEYLILYRTHGGSTSVMHSEIQLRSVHQSLCLRTGLVASYEEFLELIGMTRELNPLRRVLLRGRLARAVGKPRVRRLREELSLFGGWFRAVVRYRIVEARSVRSLHHAWRRIKPL